MNSSEPPDQGSARALFEQILASAKAPPVFSGPDVAMTAMTAMWGEWPKKIVKKKNERHDYSWCKKNRKLRKTRNNWEGNYHDYMNKTVRVNPQVAAADNHNNKGQNG